MKKPISRKSIEKKLGDVWSDLIIARAGFKCEYCGKGKPEVQLNAHHIEGKGHCGTYLKFALENGICLCVSHHTFGQISAHSTSFHGQKAFHNWLTNYKGQEFLHELKIKTKKVIKYSISDLEILLQQYKDELKKYL